MVVTVALIREMRYNVCVENEKIRMMSPTQLAFVGDAVFTLEVRRRLALSYDGKSGALTKLAARAVSAKSQAEIYVALEPLLDDEERAVAKRCKNAHTNNRAKNATAAQYHFATGLEGLIGWLYLLGREQRLGVILDHCLQGAETEGK